MNEWTWEGDQGTRIQVLHQPPMHVMWMVSVPGPSAGQFGTSPTFDDARTEAVSWALKNAPISGHEASGLSTIATQPRSVIVDRLKADGRELQVRRAADGSWWWSLYDTKTRGYPRVDAAADEASARRDAAACAIKGIVGLSNAGRKTFTDWL